MHCPSTRMTAKYKTFFKFLVMVEFGLSGTRKAGLCTQEDGRERESCNKISVRVLKEYENKKQHRERVTGGERVDGGLCLLEGDRCCWPVRHSRVPFCVSVCTVAPAPSVKPSRIGVVNCFLCRVSLLPKQVHTVTFFGLLLVWTRVCTWCGRRQWSPLADRVFELCRS